MTMTKDTYYQIGIMALLICLGGFIFRGCSHDSSYEDKLSQLNQQVDSLNKKEASSIIAVNGQKVLVNLYKDSINRVSKRQTVTDEKLVASQSTVLSLSKQIKQAKTAKDTVKYYQDCDSLAEQVDTLVATQVIDKRQIDTLKHLYISTSIHQDSIINLQQQMYSTLRGSYNAVVADDKSSIQTNIKLSKQLKTSRVWIKVLAGVAAGFAGYSLLK